LITALALAIHWQANEPVWKVQLLAVLTNNGSKNPRTKRRLNLVETGNTQKLPMTRGAFATKDDDFRVT
jgi:hypothetical protein